MQLRLFGRLRVTSKVWGFGKEIRVKAVGGGGTWNICEALFNDMIVVQGKYGVIRVCYE